MHVARRVVWLMRGYLWGYLGCSGIGVGVVSGVSYDFLRFPEKRNSPRIVYHWKFGVGFMGVSDFCA